MSGILYQDIPTGLTPDQTNTFIVTFIRDDYILPVFDRDTDEYMIIMEMLDATRIHGNIQSVVGSGLNPNDPDVKIYKSSLSEVEMDVLKKVTYTLHIYFQVVGCFRKMFGDVKATELNPIQKRMWRRFIGLILVHDMGKLWLFRLPLFFDQGHQHSADETLQTILQERIGGSEYVNHAYVKDICAMAEKHHYIETGDECRDPDVLRFRKYHDQVRADELLYASRYFPENASCYIPEKNHYEQYVKKSLRPASINTPCMLKTLGHAVHNMYDDMYEKASRFFYGIHFVQKDVLLLHTSLLAFLIPTFFDQVTKRLPKFEDNTDLIRQRLVLGLIKACFDQNMIYRPDLLLDTETGIPTRCGVFVNLVRSDGSSPKPQEFVPLKLSRVCAVLEANKDFCPSLNDLRISIGSMESVKRDILSNYTDFDFCLDDKYEA